MVSDDIVTRLREGYGQGCKCFARCKCECGCDAIWAGRYTNEAADEIERLRQLIVNFIDADAKYTNECKNSDGDAIQTVRLALELNDLWTALRIEAHKYPRTA